MNKNLAKILNEMAVIDQKMRRNAMKTGIWDKTIDRKNTLKINSKQMLKLKMMRIVLPLPKQNSELEKRIFLF